MDPSRLKFFESLVVSRNVVELIDDEEQIIGNIHQLSFSQRSDQGLWAIFF